GADTLDDVRARGMLRWGGDKEGGGPYIYPSPTNPDKLVGFEIELMELLAGRLGIKSDFQQVNWSDLPRTMAQHPEMLDVICNGIELTPEHLAQGRIATIPYFVYELQLVARKDDASLTGWADLKKNDRKRKIGVLNGSAAETYAKREFGDIADVPGYESTTDILREVVNKKLDATIQDT